MMQGTAVEAKLSGAVSAQASRFAFYTKQACTFPLALDHIQAWV